MEFRVLGPIEFRHAGQLIDTGHARQRAVLAVLLLDLGRPVPAETLIDRVWGEKTPASVRSVLYGYVARLRAALGSAAEAGVTLTRHSGAYLLQASPEQLDLYEFRRVVAEAGGSPDERAAALLSDALGTWRGPALGGVDSAWLAAMRTTLELERHTAQLDLNDARLRLGQHAALVGDLTGQAAITPGDERLAGQLMLALYRSGRPAEALRQYEQVRRYLAAELDTGPGTGLQALHQQILTADPALTAPAAPRPTSRRGVPVPRELPSDVAAFTGRLAELAALDRLLLFPRNSPGRATTAAVISAVSGTAGVGKTALAVHWAHRSAEHFPGGQLHVNLRGYDPDQPVAPADALAGFLRSLGVSGQDIPADETERAARYRSLLAGQRMLIVLDNAATVEQVRPLLPGNPDCRVLITSRDSLAGLVARDGAHRLELDLLPLPDAVRLLSELMGEQAAAGTGALTELAEQCARLPLALRIAAELVAARPAAQLNELVDELKEEHRRLDVLHADHDPRTALRAVFSWSCDQLDPEISRAFRLAGLHPGPDFDVYALAALTGASLDRAGQLLSTLTRAHLVQIASPNRYSMHDLLRAYARELAASDSDSASHRAVTRLFDYYLFAAGAAMDLWYPAETYRRRPIPPPPVRLPAMADRAEAGTWLDSEKANLVAAVVHCADHGWPAHAADLAGSLNRYLIVGCHLPEATTIYSHALQSARRSGNLAAEADALNGLGCIAGMNGHFRDAVDHLQAALNRYRECGDRLGQARVLRNLGVREQEGRHLLAAASHYQNAIAAFEDAGDSLGAALALAYLGEVEIDLVAYDEAADHLQRALPVFRDAGHPFAEADALASIGLLYFRRGQLAQASDFYRQALAIFGRIDHPTGIANGLVSLSGISMRQGQYSRAIRYLRRALALCRQAGYPRGEIWALRSLAEALTGAGQADAARAELIAALRLAAEAGNTYQEASAHRDVANSYHSAGSTSLAREHWLRSLAIFTEIGAPEADQVRAELDALASDEHVGA
jgi:DNA-binding SARP family transcriptional activator/tetratricopeptide (TPR) repeat protein